MERQIESFIRWDIFNVKSNPCWNHMLLSFLSLYGNLYQYEEGITITYQSYCSQRASLLAYRIPRVFCSIVR